jgi:1-acyl-sn-glycerol-3-phosphate acyltransferase
MGMGTFGEYELVFDERLYGRWQRRFRNFVRFGRVRTSGLSRVPESGPALLAPNHLSWKDVPFIGGVVSRPISFIATYRLFDTRVCLSMLDEHYSHFIRNRFLQRLFYGPIHAVCSSLGRMMVERVTRLGAIPAKLHSKDYSLIDAVKQAFRAGKLVLMFPEGTLGEPGKLNRFKPGVPKILKEYFEETGESVPAYPVGVQGTHRFYRPGMELGLHVGEPIDIRNYIRDTENQTLNAFNEALRERVFSLITK